MLLIGNPVDIRIGNTNFQQIELFYCLGNAITKDKFYLAEIKKKIALDKHAFCKKMNVLSNKHAKTFNSGFLTASV